MLRKLGDEESSGGGRTLSPMMFWSFILKSFLEAVILTIVVLFCLTLSTFWAARSGYDFSFLSPFLFVALLVLFVFALIEKLYSPGLFSLKIYGYVAAIIHCVYKIYETDKLIKRFSSTDNNTLDLILLSLNIVNLFISVCAITLCSTGDKIAAAYDLPNASWENGGDYGKSAKPITLPTE